MAGIPLRILGSCTSTPEANNDCSCMLLDHSILIDTGFSCVCDMQRFGENPNLVDYLFITHCHHDHYMGLPQLLFYQHTRGRMKRTDKPLVIVGPKPEVRLVVERALQFLRIEAYEDVASMPEIVPLYAGMSFETPRFRVTTCPTIHTVTGLCYRFTDKVTGASAVLTGDTAYHPGLSAHAKGAELLVHEASYGASSRDANLVGGHSGAPEAGRVAREAGVKTLALIHYHPKLRADVQQAAATVAPECHTVATQAGDVLGF